MTSATQRASHASGGCRDLHAQLPDVCGPIRGEGRDELPARCPVTRDERVLRALDLDLVRMRGVADELQPEAELIGPEERRLPRERIEPEQAPGGLDRLRRGAGPVTTAASVVAARIDRGLRPTAELMRRLNADGDEHDVGL